VISLVIVGAAGRMGRAVAEAAGGLPDFSIRALVDVAENLRGDGVCNAKLETAVGPGGVVVEVHCPSCCR